MDAHDIMLAAKGQALNAYLLDDAKEVVRMHVDRAYTLTEQPKPDAFVYDQTVSDVLDKVLRSYGYITSQEMALVVEAGVGGELTRQTKPSAAAIFGWIAAYMDSDLRKAVMRDLRRNTRDSIYLSPEDVASLLVTASRRPLDTPELDSLRHSGNLTSEVTAELNRMSELRALRSLWQEYKALGHLAEDHLDGYCAMAMDGLIKREVFKISDEDWRQARREAGLLDVSAQGIGAALSTPTSRTKRAMLEMCFRGLAEAGMELNLDR